MPVRHTAPLIISPISVVNPTCELRPSSRRRSAPARGSWLSRSPLNEPTVLQSLTVRLGSSALTCGYAAMAPAAGSAQPVNSPYGALPAPRRPARPARQHPIAGRPSVSRAARD
jgi:hypothetical protein